jgi:hypothetical protein
MNDRGVATRRHETRGRAEANVDAPKRESRTDREPQSPAVAGYIADMTAQLETMATAAHLDLLAYFLAMARAEGESAAHLEIGAAREAARPG